MPKRKKPIKKRSKPVKQAKPSSRKPTAKKGKDRAYWDRRKTSKLPRKRNRQKTIQRSFYSPRERSEFTIKKKLIATIPTPFRDPDFTDLLDFLEPKVIRFLNFPRNSPVEVFIKIFLINSDTGAERWISVARQTLKEKSETRELLDAFKFSMMEEQYQDDYEVIGLEIERTIKKETEKNARNKRKKVIRRSKTTKHKRKKKTRKVRRL